MPSTGQSTGDSYLISGNVWIYTGSTDEGSINGFKNAGNIQGPEGRGISSIVIENGELKITYTDGTSSIVGNVIGPQGEQGIQGEKGESGLNGENGKSLEFDWNGTQLGIRLEGETDYTYVDLKGEVGNDGTGISGIEFTSSTGGDTPGIAGATDTYTITLTDNTTYTFDVYNGNNGGDPEVSGTKT